MTTTPAAMSGINEHHPFPDCVDADEDRTFYEVPLHDGSGFQYVIIRAKRYMDERQRDLVRRGLVSIEDFYPEVKWMDHMPSDGTMWLYAVESIEVDSQHHENQLMFDDNAKNFAERIFDSFEEALRYCRETFEIDIVDFKESSKTHYPQT
jgi:hypothetical protein